MLNEEKIPFFFSRGGLYTPARPIGAAPLNPACFWIENSSWNRFALNGIQIIAGFTVFFCITRKIKIEKNLNFDFTLLNTFEKKKLMYFFSGGLRLHILSWSKDWLFSWTNKLVCFISFVKDSANHRWHCQIWTRLNLFYVCK